MQHRDDIDGLRAVAVVSVVLYHLGFSGRLAGGFVGVDVFFVISGYLITGILKAEVDQGALRLTEFYNRRVRRIFPALFAVQAFSIVASAVLLFPWEAKEVGKDALWSLSFLSNLAFYRSSGYFDQSARSAPLLHTWSLSVEEQFYIGLPLLLLLLRRVRHGARIGVISALLAASFVASVWMVRFDSPRAFYLVQYRAWELLLGSLLALGAFPRVRARLPAEVLGVAGLGLVLLGVLKIDGETPFPGLWALPPCLGTLAILHSGVEVRTLVSRLLGTRPFRFVGLVSYSFYLWHWPAIALHHARHATMSNLDRVEILAATFAVSVLSYRYIERPFREKPYRRQARTVLKLALLGMAAMASCAVLAPAAAARLRPSSELADVTISYLKYDASSTMREGTCFLSQHYDDASAFRKDVCLALRPDRKNFLLVGDSHAAHYWAGLHALRPEINFLQATASGCSAVHGGPGAKRCTDLVAYVYDQFLPAHHLDAIILGGRWASRALPAVEQTVAYLRPFADRVIVLGPVVEYDEPLPKLLASAIQRNDPDLPARHRSKRQREIDRQYADAFRSTRAEYYSVYGAICPQDDCTVWASAGVPLQFDYGHLTAPGARLALQRLGPGLFD